MFSTLQVIAYCFISLVAGATIGLIISALMSASRTYIDDSEKRPRVLCDKEKSTICIGCPNLYDCYNDKELELLRKLIYESKDI